MDILNKSRGEINRILAKLKEALKADVGELPACNYAGITKEEYDLIVKMHPDIKELAERAGDVIGVKASMNIANAIDDQDVKVSQWYKEHTDPKFSKKMQVDVGVSASDRGKEVDELFNELD